MGAPIIGRTECPECGFASAHVKRSDKCTFRYCPECGAQHHARTERQVSDLMAKTRLDAPAASPQPTATPKPTQAPAKKAPDPIGHAEVMPHATPTPTQAPEPTPTPAPAKRSPLFGF